MPTSMIGVLRRSVEFALYVNLRGFDPGGSALHVADALRGFLDTLGVPRHRVPTDLDAQAALFRSVLAGRRVMVLLDNARDAEQVRPLLPGAPGCLVVVTSRNRLTGLVAAEGAHPLPLGMLSAAEARELLTRRLGTTRVANEPQAVEEILKRCAGLPLALVVVAARASADAGMPLAALARDLHDVRTRLDAFAGEDKRTDVRAVFSASYKALGPPASQLFRLLGLHPGPDITIPAAASLAGITPQQVRPLLAELASAHLLTEHAPGRYAFHDLLRTYATELALAIDTDDQRRHATHRLLDHYLHTAHAAALLLDPQREPITLAASQAGTTRTELTDHDHALDWFTTEHRGLLAAVELARSAGFDVHIWQLAWCLTNFLDRQGHWRDQAETGERALHAAQRGLDLAGQAHARRGLGRAHARLGRYGDAHTHLSHALELFDAVGDHTSHAHTHLDCGWVCARQGHLRQALNHAAQALDLYQATGHPGQADALNAVGWYHAQLGDHQQAILQCKQALSLHHATGNHHGEANAWDSLGYAHQRLGNHQRAASCYEHAVDLLHQEGDRYNEAVTLNRLGDTRHAAGNPEAARADWQRALAILDHLGHDDANQVRAKLNPGAGSDHSEPHHP